MSGIPMRCVLCKACLHHEAVVASHYGDSDRMKARYAIKGVDWLWRTGAYAEDTEVVLCGHGCLADWMAGSDPVAANTLAAYRAKHVEPRAKHVTMTTDTHTPDEIDMVFSEVLVGGLPPRLPAQAVRSLLESHGKVEHFVFSKEDGVAYCAYSCGAEGESLFVSCNGAVLPPSIGTETPFRLDVEFLHFLPAFNDQVYDDMFGAKCTRQLLRAMPRVDPPRRPFVPVGDAADDRNERTCLFKVFARHLDAVHATDDHKLLVRRATSDTNLVLCRNWILYRYNLPDALQTSERLLERFGDVMKGLQAIESVHVSTCVGDVMKERAEDKLRRRKLREAKRNKTEGAAAGAAPPPPAPPLSQRAFEWALAALPYIYSVHTLLLGFLVVVSASLLQNLLE